MLRFTILCVLTALAAGADLTSAFDPVLKCVNGYGVLFNSLTSGSICDEDGFDPTDVGLGTGTNFGDDNAFILGCNVLDLVQFEIPLKWDISTADVTQQRRVTRAYLELSMVNQGYQHQATSGVDQYAMYQIWGNWTVADFVGLTAPNTGNGETNWANWHSGSAGPSRYAEVNFTENSDDYLATFSLYTRRVPTTTTWELNGKGLQALTAIHDAWREAGNEAAPAHFGAVLSWSYSAEVGPQNAGDVLHCGVPLAGMADYERHHGFSNASSAWTLTVEWDNVAAASSSVSRNFTTTVTQNFTATATTTDTDNEALWMGLGIGAFSILLLALVALCVAGRALVSARSEMKTATVSLGALEERARVRRSRRREKAKYTRLHGDDAAAGKAASLREKIRASQV
jgi:hypothetical protein